MSLLSSVLFVEVHTLLLKAIPSDKAEHPEFQAIVCGKASSTAVGFGSSRAKKLRTPRIRCCQLKSIFFFSKAKRNVPIWAPLELEDLLKIL